MNSVGKLRKIEIIRSVQTPLGFFVLVVLVVEGFLATAISFTEAFDRTIVIIGMFALIFALVGVVAFLAYKSPESLSGKPAKRTGLTKMADGLVSNEPVSVHDIRRWLGRWNCRWTIYVEGKHFAPYVDDGITLEDIDPDTGVVSGTGHTAYNSGGTYKIAGRILEGRVGIFAYSSKESAFSGMDGTLALRMNAVGKVSGWWLGIGRDGTEIGGRIDFERYRDDKLYKFKLYPYPPPVDPKRG